MTPNPSLAYRQQAVRTASPLGLVVLLYDAMLLSLNRAIRAMDAGDIELRVKELNHALATLDQLQRTLDFEKGGDVAANLDHLYDLYRAAILNANFTQTRGPLVQVAKELQGVRDAWREADLKSCLPSPGTYSSGYSSGYPSGNNPAGAGGWSA
jgi:flagellar secretion chaperone FliS